jgi:ketosteroid isomerase-like protein
MKKLLIIISSGLLMLLALQCNQQSALDTTEADKETIKGINPVWFNSYNSGDVHSIVALYSEDAVLNPPGAPPARGHSEIREFLTKDIEISKTGGVTLNGNPATEVGVSDKLGWEWGTFTVKDKSGSTIDRGKYVTVCEKKDGKWLIIRDIWNSDGSM